MTRSTVVTGRFGSPKGSQAVAKAKIISALKQRVASEMGQPQLLCLLAALQLVFESSLELLCP